jgi:MFS family permease
LFLAYCLAFSVRDFAGSSMNSLSSLFLQKAHGYDPKWTGLALSAIYVAATISNPLFGSLSDNGRKRWITLALVVAAVIVALFPHMPPHWTIPVLVVYGFFFLASYPMTEAALMESVPDAARGRVFGLFVMGGGVFGNLSHWAVGLKVKHLGDAAHSVSAYFPTYSAVALLMLASLTGLFCLPAIQRREGPVAHKAAGEDSMPLLT